MKKIILSLFLTLYLALSFGQSVLITSALPLANSGSVTIPSGYPTQLYWSYNGTYTLSNNLSLIYSGTPLIGSNFTIWFDSTTIIPNTYHVFILNQDFTSLLTGTKNLFITFTYNGVSWTSRSVDAGIANAIDTLVSLNQLNDTLQNYVNQGYLSSSLALYAPLEGGTFTGPIRVPAISQTDSSQTVASTSFVKKAVNNLSIGAYALLSGASFTGAVTVPTISGHTDNSTNAASTAFVQAVATNTLNTVNTTFTPKLSTLDTLAAGTISLTTYVGGIYTKVEPYIITGNIILTSGVLPAGSVSTIVIELPFSGSYTVTAGANMNFTTITGANTHTSVLTLTWSNTQQRYNQEAFSQN